MIADSITKEVGDFALTKVLSFRGSTVQDLYRKLRLVSLVLDDYECVILHVGTNNFGSKAEWGYYLKMIRGVVTRQQYDDYIKCCNPADANLRLDDFKKCYEEVDPLLSDCSSPMGP